MGRVPSSKFLSITCLIQVPFHFPRRFVQEDGRSISNQFYKLSTVVGCCTQTNLRVMIIPGESGQLANGCLCRSFALRRTRCARLLIRIDSFCAAPAASSQLRKNQVGASFRVTRRSVQNIAQSGSPQGFPHSFVTAWTTQERTYAISCPQHLAARRAL